MSLELGAVAAAMAVLQPTASRRLRSPAANQRRLINWSKKGSKHAIFCE